MTTFNSKLRLQLLANKKLQRRSGKGFTLIEMMVTVATLGALAAAAFPAFTNAQQRAEAGAMIGSIQGYAKECAVKAVTGDTTPISVGSGITAGTATTADTNCSDGSKISNTTAFNENAIGGLECGDNSTGAVQTASAGTDKFCILEVTSSGNIVGSWSATAAS